ncbi:phosphoenolpyruvate carboxykinase (GTP) [Candidatus Bathyarchaeota archaeon]|nr:phosphoenolpyruvate carboxykinase (GTP) [Candidatus Bathyarchaeota archaeon]
MDPINDKELEKLKALNNQHVIDIMNEYVSLLKPEKVTVITDDDEDIAYVRQRAIDLGEEIPLKMEGHTVHYDGYHDQARDKGNTKVLITEDMEMSERINSMEREAGLKEVLGIMDGAMKGKEAIVRFFALGPTNSEFTICAMQITDSLYVAHSEDILYRKGYEEFKKLEGKDDFFLFVHSAGELDGVVTKNVDKRRIYVDLLENRVLTVNNQYAGNSLGLKKLALRLAIYKANQEAWLTEHMFVMGIHPPGKDRVTYFTGAYPSACGKTSTAMIPGQTIIGDDIAYMREKSGKAHAVNIEQGLFGIIRDVNPEDDPVIYEALNTPKELIFSNVLVKDGVPYWLGMGKETPKEGMNHSGKDWHEGKKDASGKEIPLAHPNARYTVRIRELENADPRADDPEGVPVGAILYGGRDSDTNVPVFQSLNWKHGVFIGATIESETTSATLGKEGVRKSSPMANMDFLVVPLGKYLDNHRKFGEGLEDCPLVFATNYFLKDEKGNYYNKKVDKKIWVIWAEGRVHGDYGAIETPVGFLPKLDDLQALFKDVFDREYTKEEYVAQFSLRTDKLLEKLDRMEEIYKEEPNIPQFFWDILASQRKSLQALQEEHGKALISPLSF